MNSDLRPVRHDPALGMCGAFRALRKGERGKLDVEQAWGGLTIRVRGPDALGIADQSVLFAVLEVAAGQVEQPGADVTPVDPLWALVGHQDHLFSTGLVRVQTSFRQLSLLCGRGDSGGELAQVRESLRRLAETTIWARQGDLEGASRLLGWHVSDARRVVLALNWRLTSALQHVPYSRISMQERAYLTSEPAKALHAALSCMVNAGRSWAFPLQNLQRHVWGDCLETGATYRRRLVRLREALGELDRLPGWTVDVAGGKASVARASMHTPAGARRADRSSPGGSLTHRKNRPASSGNRSQAIAEDASWDGVHTAIDASELFKQS